MAGIVTLSEAQKNLSRLVDRAAAGEEIVIAKDGKPKAKLVPFRAPAGPREPANLLRITFVGEDCDDPLPMDFG